MLASVLLALVVVWLAVVYGSDSTDLARVPNNDDDDTGIRLQRTSDAIVAKPSFIPIGLARAYAALGEIADGRRVQLPALDADSLRFLDQARALLALQRLQRGRGPTGISDTQSPGNDHASFTDDADTGTSALSVKRSDDLVTADTQLNGVALRAIDERGLPKQFTTGDKKTAPPPIVGDMDKELLVAGAFVAIPYKPGLAAGKPLIIRNHSGAGYAISLHGSDFGTVRVNGGLVIPGRFYQIVDAVHITSDVPVNIHIRPLDVVPSFDIAPAIPSATS